MRSQRKRTLAKKPRQADMSDNMSAPSGSMDDAFVNSDSDITIDLGNAGAAQSVYTIDTMDSITIGNLDWNSLGNGTVLTAGTDTLSWDSNYSNYSYSAPADARVNINKDGIDIKEGGDIKIGGKSLTESIAAIEDRLAILKPNPELEDRWDQLKDLRRQYETLEKDILEKEKIMEILKRD